MNQNEINEVVRLHEMWLRGETGGKHADFSGANHLNADFSGADLRHACFVRANLRHADFSRANLTSAHLSLADLSQADFLQANLTGADLSGADLFGADLSRAHLGRADFNGAILLEVNLSGANLAEALGICYAQCSWDTHGECGRMLTGVLIGRRIRMFCGCFNGTVEELEQYIKDGDPELRESRTLALHFVLARLRFEEG